MSFLHCGGEASGFRAAFHDVGIQRVRQSRKRRGIRAARRQIGGDDSDA
jgi:hypothetical protein